MADGFDGNKRYVNSNRYEDEGVYYSPSYKNGNVKANPSKQGSKQRVKKGNSSQFGVFITITICAGIIMCLIIFILVFSAMSNSRTEANTSIRDNNFNTEDIISNANDLIEVVALIKEINGSKFKILNIADEVSYTVNVLGSTALKDKYGSNMSAAEFKIGDIIQTEFDSQTKNAQFVRISGEAWEHKNITNAIVSADNKTISFGNQKYSFTEELILLNAPNFSSVTEIKPTDTISLRGTRQKVWTVTLDKSHGNIFITNKDHIKEGIIEVDTSIFMQLNDADKIELTEGQHKVVVKGSNIEPYVREINIGAHDEIEIDLSNVQIKTGVLIFRLSEKDYSVYVNDKLTDVSEPLVLEYNTYNIRAEKENYESYERTVAINKASTQLNIELVKIEAPTEDISVPSVPSVEIGSLKIDTNPSGVGADIYIDNAYIGIAPVTAQVEHGEHRILVRKSGYADISVPVTVGSTPQDITIRIHEISSNNNESLYLED